MPLVRPVTHRAIRSFPKGFCPSDLQAVRLFYAPLQRDLVAGAIGDATFVRATTATYIDQDTGFITAAASGEARFEANGYLSEGQRTNLCLQSGAFDVDGSGSPWEHDEVTVTANATTAPDGTSTADELFDTVANDDHFIFQAITTSAVNHTYSIYVKSNTQVWCNIADRGGNFKRTTFNAATGAFGTNQERLIDRQVEDVGDGWYRVSITFAADGVLTAPSVYLADSDAFSPSYAGDGSSLYIWGAQLEA